MIHDDVTDQVTELLPGGHDIVLSNSNVISYLYTYANYKLNETIRRQLTCFMRGFHRVLNRKWLRIFSEEELGSIINGNESVLDVDDFIANVRVQGNANLHYVHGWLKQVLQGWPESTKKKFLKFVTSYKNPPLFGFETMDPAVKIRKSTGNLRSCGQSRRLGVACCVDVHEHADSALVFFS